MMVVFPAFMQRVGSARARAVSRAFGRSRSGATAVEFALVAPVLFFMLLEIVQGSLYLYCSAIVEQAAAVTTRTVMVGGLDSRSASAGGFREAVVCPALQPALRCDRVITSLEVATVGGGAGYAAFVRPGQSGLVPLAMDNAKTRYCAGGPSTYQYLQIFYAVPLFSPIWRSAAGDDWNGEKVAFVRSAAAFRNEPYTGASIETGC